MWATSDEALFAGYATGDPTAALVFVRRFQARAFGLALTICRDRAEAEEVAQEAFVRAWRHAGSFDPRRGSVAGWLLGIVRNAAIDRSRVLARQSARGHGPLPEELPDEADVEGLVGQRADVSRIVSALDRLPDEQRRALLAVTISGLSAREYSEASGIPLGTVKTRVRLGLRKLRRDLEEVPVE
jgi:RNA polymerase sigma factor (sigma-70 family)